MLGMTASLNTGVIPPEPVGDRCGRARRFAGHEQAAFAELLGTSRRTVSRIESGVKVPTRAELVSWSFATGVDLHWLETGEAPSPGDGDGASALPQLDSNQQPFDNTDAEVIELYLAHEPDILDPAA